jgi:hypothetical protein
MPQKNSNERCGERSGSIRLFLSVADVERDPAGNCRAATVGMLDHAFGRPAWRRWNIGQKAHFHPFKVALLDTRRAGLHLVSEWRRDGERDLRFAAVHSIREPGIFVLNPSNVAAMAEPIADAFRDPIEARYVRSNLCDRFGLDGVLPPTHVERLGWFTEDEERELHMGEGRVAA